MTWADSMHNAVDEGERGEQEGTGHGVFAFEAFHAGREVALQALLAAQHPSKDPTEGIRRLHLLSAGTEGRRRRSGRGLRRRDFRGKRIERLHLRVGERDRRKRDERAKQKTRREVAPRTCYR